MYLFFDTETTGFPSANIDARDPKQGRICQLAALLTDKDGRSMAEFSTLIRPDGWAIGSGAQAVHGLTDGLCDRYGIPSDVAFSMFRLLAARAEMVIAHNLDFDIKMIAVEARAHNYVDEYHWTENNFCTMKSTTDICRIPKAKGNGFKWPSLDEALQFFCGRPVGKDAHDAMIDTRACKDIFFALQDRNLGEGLV